MGLLWLKSQIKVLRTASSRDKVNQKHYHTPGGTTEMSTATEHLTGVGIHNTSAITATNQSACEENR